MTGYHRPILTAAAMRAAEEHAMANGTSVDTLMDCAGHAVAEAAWRFGGGRPVLILCGPGNNGGDGYVAARYLAERGVPVRVAASADPRTDVSIRARQTWTGPVEPLATAAPGVVLVDALFGTGLTRPLDGTIADPLARCVAAAHFSLAVDVPSGMDADDGALLAPLPHFDMTIALGALKPAHRLQPAAAHCGAVIIGDIGIAIESRWAELAQPRLKAPGPLDHKYSRGLVAVVAGDMPGAARLAAMASARAGAGYVRLYGAPGQADAIVSHPIEALENDLADARIGALLIGPGLGRSNAARRLLALALASDRPLVIDADALHLLKGVGLKTLARRTAPVILTPHGGEFSALFGDGQGSKIDRTLVAAARANAVIVHKGADSVVAAPDGQVTVAPPASTWLSTAGTGDVLAGITAAMLARGLAPLAAAEAGLWLHAEVARLSGPAFIADDLASNLARAIAPCL